MSFATVFYNYDVTVGSPLKIFFFFFLIYLFILTFFVFADELAVINQG